MPIPLTLRNVKGTALTHTEGDDNFKELAGAFGWFDHEDLATASTPISITATTPGTAIPLTNDGLGSHTILDYPPSGVTEIWDTVAQVFDFSQLALGDKLEIKLDLDVIVASVNTEVNIDFVGGVGGTEIIPFIAAQNFKNTGTFKVVRYMGVFMENADMINNTAVFKAYGDKTYSLTVNSWYVSLTKYGGQ